MMIFPIILSSRRLMAGMCVLCAFVLFGAAHVNAQMVPTGTESIIEIEPRYPKPGQEFTARLRIYSDTVKGVAWTVDGSTVASSGQRNEIRLTAPVVLGESMRIVARAETNTAPITLERTVTAMEVDLIVEGDTIAPYFYEGRRVPGPSGAATLVAIPHLYETNGVRVPDANLVYTWSVNNEIAAEGRGVSRFIVPVKHFGDANVRLQITESSGRMWYETILAVPRAEPMVVFYPVSPLTGLSHNAVLGAYLEAVDETTVRAEPYFIDVAVYKNAQYAWSVDGATVDSQSADPQLITLRGTAGSASDIGFSIHNLSALSQYAVGLFRIVFN